VRAAASEITKVIATNRKATHDYFIHDKMEAGIQLVGSEVKSLRGAHVVIADGWVEIRKGQAFLHNVQIQEYSQANRWGHEPIRVRKLLLHKREIRKLIGKTVEKGMTLVPTRLYFKDGRVKVAVGLAKGKQAYDKRETIKRRETDRETRAAIKSKR
jgi:SsrA-binding protein